MVQATAARLLSGDHGFLHFSDRYFLSYVVPTKHEVTFIYNSKLASKIYMIGNNCVNVHTCRLSSLDSERTEVIVIINKWKNYLTLRE